MTVEDSSSSVQYSTNGTAGPFPVPFYFLSSGDLSVVYITAAGNSTTLALTTHYNVTGAGNPAGGSIGTVAAYPNDGGRLLIRRRLPLTQLTDYEEGDAFPASAHERALDRLTMIAQQQADDLSRTVMAPVGDSASMALPGASGRLGKMLAFNSVSGSPEATPFTVAQLSAAIIASFAGAPVPINTPEVFGATGDGVTDDSAAFAMGWLLTNSLFGNPDSIYAVKDLNQSGRTFDGRGCVMRDAVGARWGVKLKGYHPQFRNVTWQDAGNYVRVTTLAADAATSSAEIELTSVSGVEIGQVIFVDLDANDVRWQTVVTDVSGSIVTLRDAIPSEAAAGAEVVALFGLMWVEDATWVDIENVLVVNANGALLLKPSSAAATCNLVSITRFHASGAKYFGGAKIENVADVKMNDVKLRGGRVETTIHAGTGGAGPFSFPTPVYLLRDVTVYVDGVLKTYSTHWTYSSQTGIEFTVGNYPAPGAVITLYHFRDGYRGWIEDQRNTAIISGGNNYHQLEVLDFYIGMTADEAELTDLSGCIIDSCQYSGLVMNNCQSTVRFNGLFIGWAGNSIKAFGTTAGVSFDVLHTFRVPEAQAYPVTRDDNIFVGGSASIRINTDNWTGQDYQSNVAAGGWINFAGGREIAVFSATTVAAGSTVYLTPAGQQASPFASSVIAGSDLQMLRLIVQCGTVPGAGQSFTYTVNVNNVDSAAGTAVISDTGVFNLVVPFVDGVNRNSNIVVKLVTSPGAALSTHRAVIVAKYG